MELTYPIDLDLRYDKFILTEAQAKGTLDEITVDMKYISHSDLQIDFKDLKIIVRGIITSKLLAGRDFSLVCERKEAPYLRIVLRIKLKASKCMFKVKVVSV